MAPQMPAKMPPMAEKMPPAEPSTTTVDCSVEDCRNWDNGCKLEGISVADEGMCGEYAPKRQRREAEAPESFNGEIGQQMSKLSKGLK